MRIVATVEAWNPITREVTLSIPLGGSVPPWFGPQTLTFTLQAEEDEGETIAPGMRYALSLPRIPSLLTITRVSPVATTEST